VTEQLMCTLTLDPDHRPVLLLRGEVDLATADQFRDAALGAVRRHYRVVFDVAGVMLLDASGLRVLHAVAREARRLGRPAPVLRGVRPLLARSLKITGLHDAFEREPAWPEPGLRGPVRSARAGMAAACAIP